MRAHHEPAILAPVFGRGGFGTDAPEAANSCLEQGDRMRAFLRYLGLTLLLATGLVGCKHRDLVEAELRYQNRRVRELEQKLCQKQAEVYTLQSMVSSGEKASADGSKDTPETIYRREAMSRVGLGLTTGPRDLDHDGFDDAVQYSVVCYDYDGDAFKCPGSVQLELVAVQESGVPVTVSTWQIPPDRLRETWRSSVVGAAYQIVLPAPTLQDSRKWQAIVRFSTLDGRVFQSSKDFELAKPKAAKKGVPPADLRSFPSDTKPLKPPTEPLPENSTIEESPKGDLSPPSIVPSTPDPSSSESAPSEPAPLKEPAIQEPTLPPIPDPLTPPKPPAIPEINPELQPAHPIVPNPTRQTTSRESTMLSQTSIDPMVKPASGTMERPVRLRRPVLIR
jgi:hypothetical protein